MRIDILDFVVLLFKIYEICKTIPWSEAIKQKRLNCFSHLNRIPDSAPAKLAFREAFFKPPKKLRGGQPLNWLHTIKKDFKNIDLRLGALGCEVTALGAAEIDPALTLSSMEARDTAA